MNERKNHIFSSLILMLSKAGIEVGELRKDAVLKNAGLFLKTKGLILQNPQRNIDRQFIPQRILRSLE